VGGVSAAHGGAGDEECAGGDADGWVSAEGIVEHVCVERMEDRVCGGYTGVHDDKRVTVECSEMCSILLLSAYPRYNGELRCW
jgi:hypothetical protein